MAIFGGWGADKFANWYTKKYNGGRREPEVHLLNWIVPMLCSILGCVLFGYAGQNPNTVHWFVFLLGIFFLAYGLLTINIIQSVYVVESFPEWAGYVINRSTSQDLRANNFADRSSSTSPPSETS